MLVFKDAKVPWEKVIVHDNPALSRNIYIQTAAHVISNHQSNVRFGVEAALHARRCEPDHALHRRARHSGGARHARPARRDGGGLQCHDRRADRGLSTVRQRLRHLQSALPLCRHSLGDGEPFPIDRHHARADGRRPVSVPGQHRRAGGSRSCAICSRPSGRRANSPPPIA